MPTLAEYEDWKAGLQKSSIGAANVVLSDAQTVNPDQFAGDIKLGKAFGLPAGIVAEGRDGFAARLQSKRNETILKSSPLMASWLGLDDNAKVAHDDLENLSWFEAFGRGAVATAQRAHQRVDQMGNQYMLEQTARRASDRGMTFGQILDDERDALQGPNPGETHKAWAGIGDVLAASARYLDARYADLIGADDKEAAARFAAGVAAAQERMAATPKSAIAQSFEDAAMVKGAGLGESLVNFGSAFMNNPIGGLSWAVETAGESAPQLAAALGATATAGPGAGLAVLGTGSYLTERYTAPTDFLAENGIDIRKPEDVQRLLSDPKMLEDAANRGVIRGAIIGAFDVLSGGIAGRALARNPFVEALAQSVQQAIFGSAGEYSARVAAGQEIDWSDVLSEGFAEIATAPVDMGVAGRKFNSERRAAKAAERAQITADQIAQAAQASKLKQRLDGRFMDWVNHSVAGSPVENVYVPAEAMNTYFQGARIDPEDFLAELPGASMDEFRAALATGGDLKIPTGTYAAKIAGSEFDPFLRANMRFDPDAMTLTQAKDFNERVADIQQEAFEEAENQRLADEELRSHEQIIYDEMVSRLRAAGRATDVATNEATVWPAFYRSMAERSGLTTEELLQAFPLPKVEGARPEGLQPKNVDELTRTLAMLRGRSAGAQPARESLLEFIDKRGGINDPGGELAARDAEIVKRGKGKKSLRLRRGVGGKIKDMFGGGSEFGMDSVAQAAVESGYLSDDPRVQAWKNAVAAGEQVPDITGAMMDAIDAELAGKPSYSQNQIDERQQEKDAALDNMEEWLSRRGISLDQSDAEIRAAIEAQEAEEGRKYGQAGENLIVQHNLSAANLLHADKMRGLAVPSLAISNVDHPLDNFGEITLLGGPDLVDPRKDSASKVFDADVYSPRYPTVRYKIAKPAMNKVWKRLGSVSDELGHVLSGELDNGEVERKGLEAFRDSSAVQLEFLRSTGRDIDLPKNTARSDYLTMVPELAGMFVDNYSVNNDPAVKAAVERAIDLQVQRVHDAAPDISIDELRDGYYLRGEIRRSVIDDIVQEKRVMRDPGVDRSAARYALRNAVAPHADEFSAWVESEFGNVFAGEAIETQTSSGDWKYLPHTLDNVVKVLRRKLRDGEGFNYGVASIRSTVANQFKSVSAIKAARGNLIPSDAMKALKDETDNEFVALAGKFAEHAGSLGKGFGWLDVFSERLKEVAERGVRVLNNYENGVPPELAQEAVAFLDKLANMPTEYFEAKLQRAVDLSEFKAAVIPSDAPQAVKNVLKFARVPVFEYSRSADGSRASTIRAAAGGGGLLFQSGNLGPRGQIQFPAAGIGQGNTVINLFENANLSTFLHESGHMFLSVTQAIASGPNAPSDVVGMFDTVKAWWRSNAADVARDAHSVTGLEISAADVEAAIDNGTTGDAAKDSAIDVGMQEQFARGFEAYVMEGKSPSIELRSAFERFRAWLLNIYKRVVNLGVNLSPEIRTVFDRMLASDAEIERARTTVDDEMIFKTAAETGISEDQFKELAKLHNQAQDEAKQKLLKEAMAPIQREREKWFKEERAKVREEVEKDVNGQRAYRALEWLGNRRWLGDDKPEDMPDMRMSKDMLVERYGEGVLKTLPRGKFTVYAVEGGMDPDEVAGWFGYNSGDELVKALETAPARKDAIEAETDRLMRERHGDVLRDGSVEEAALAAVHGDKRGQYLAAELKTLKALAGDTSADITMQDAREIARRTLNRMQVRDAINSRRYLAAERRHADDVIRLSRITTRERMRAQDARRDVGNTAREGIRSEDAAALEKTNAQVERANVPTDRANDRTAELVKAARNRLVNHALYAESIKIADEVEKAERLVAKIEKSTRKIRSERRRLGETSIAGDYVEALEAIIYGYEFRKVSGVKINRRAALLAYVEMMTEDGRANELGIPQSVLDDASVQNYRTLTVEHLRGVIDSLKNIEHTARRKGQMLINKRKRTFDDATSSVADAIEANVKGRPVSWVKDDGITAKSVGLISGYISTIQSATTILRQMDGREDMGPAYEALKADMDEAAYAEREMRKDATEKILGLYSVYSKDEQRQMAVREVIPELGGQSFSKWNLISMALNMGNEGNLARLTNAKAKMHLTPAQVEIVKNRLDARDAQFIQSVWNYIGSFRPKIAERDNRIRGFEPKWVDAQPVTIGGVDLMGGYYPIKYEGRLGGARFSSGDTDADILNSMMSSGYSSAQTKDGHLKARGENVRQSLSLDMSVIPQHVNEVIHDLAFSEAVVNTWRILTSGKVEQAMLNAGLDNQYKMLKLWVQDAATGQVSAGSGLAKSVSFLRSGFTYSKLALNLKTILLQPLGLFQSAVVVGKRNLAEQMIRYTKNPVEMTNDVLARSRMMWERRETFNKDIMDAAAKSNMASPTSGKLRTGMDDYVIPFGMAGITYSQFYLVDIPTWSAAFQKGVKQFKGDETKAAQYADMTVNRSQGSGIWSDRSGIERGSLATNIRQNPFVLLLTTLGSYFFAKTNLIIERTQRLRAEPLSVGASMSYALDMMLLLSGEAAVIALLGEAFGDDDDDDDDSILTTIAMESLQTFLAGLPGARDVAGLAQGFQAGTYAAILQTFWAPIGQAKQGEVDKALVKSVVNLVGLAGRLPSSQANRIIDGAWRDLEGEDVRPLDYLVGRKY